MHRGAANIPQRARQLCPSAKRDQGEPRLQGLSILIHTGDSIGLATSIPDSLPRSLKKQIMVYRIKGRLIKPHGSSYWDQNKWRRKDGACSGHLSFSRRGRAGEEREQSEQATGVMSEGGDSAAWGQAASWETTWGGFEGWQELSTQTTSKQGQLARGDWMLREQEELFRAVGTRQQLDSKRAGAGQSRSLLPLHKEVAPASQGCPRPWEGAGFQGRLLPHSP